MASGMLTFSNLSGACGKSHTLPTHPQTLHCFESFPFLTAVIYGWGKVKKKIKKSVFVSDQLFLMDCKLGFFKIVSSLTASPWEQFGYSNRFSSIKLRSNSPYLNKTILHNSPEMKAQSILFQKLHAKWMYFNWDIYWFDTEICPHETSSLFKLTRLK